MQGVEFRALREWMGVDQEWMARELGVSESTVRKWERGQHPVPAGVAAEVSGLAALTDGAVRGDVGAPPSGQGWPERWRRHVAVRQARESA